MKEPKKKEIKKKEVKPKKTAKKTENPDLVQFAVTARKYKTLLTKKFQNRKVWIDPNIYEIQSFIPGTIISIDVKEGDVVKEGEQLLILEAMKMLNKIEMPFTAKIKKINVNVGDRLPKNTLMIELEDA
jgi:biotin carboxyl carrier protein